MAKHTGIWFAVLWLAQGCIGPALLERLYDADNDGYRSAIGGYGDDCNDSNAAVHPDMPETCGDNLDNDCDGLVDEWGENGITVFEDLDGDGVGSNKTRVFCTVPETGWSHESGDCNDQNDSIFPGAAEVCNGLDDDCNLQIDDNAAPLTFHPDLDGDGYTVPTESVQGCLPPEGWTSLSLGTDCDDASAAIHPGADEVWYDGVDQDCDPTTEWDQDGDGALHPSAPATPLSGAEDCDDLDPHISPFAEEVWYDGVDQDCDPTTEWDRDGDGLLPLGAPSTVFSSSDCDDGTPIITVPKLYYPDSDLDGFGSEQAPVLACTPPGPLFALIAGDCDDSSAAHHPGAPELCNEVDDNCDGTVDEGIGTLHWPDLDADGAGDAVASPALMCFTTPGWVTNSTDCDDSTESVHPGIDESCDGIDNDCDGLTDEGTRVLSYLDFDGDGHGANGLP
ncbi:MAG: putative metal-binding motif-containing protein, partial [Myxococcota bacterium]